jgi:hypothetical protein
VARASAPVLAGFYRNWAFCLLLISNLFCIICPFVGTFARPILSREGDISRSEQFGVLLVVLVGFTFPCFPPFCYFATARYHRRLRAERLPALLGRLLLGLATLTALVAIIGVLHSVCLANYLEHPPAPAGPYRSLERTPESLCVFWFTAVGLLLAFCFIFNLMPNPFQEVADPLE